LCSLNFNRLQILIKDNPKIQQSVDCAMSRELNNTHEHLYSLGSHNVEQRLAFFLIHLQNKLGAMHATLRAIRLPMSREDLKSYLGVTSESLSRAFTSLEKRGYFKVRNKEISDIDFERLKMMLDFI
jgi:CRP/FNR family transcriptional regulator